MSQFFTNSGSPPPGDEFIAQIDGDRGFVTGTTVTVFANQAAINSGSSVSFVGNDLTTMTMNLSDTGFNTILGNTAGNSTLEGNGALQNVGIGPQVFADLVSGEFNIAFGSRSLESLTDGGNNIGIGGALQSLLDGEQNIGIGENAGNAYTGTETQNICLGYATTGTVGESNVMRLGALTAGGPTKTFVAGITNNTSQTNAQPIFINTVTAQLGVGALSGSLVLIQSQTITSSTAAVQFISGITGYNNFVLQFNQVIGDGGSTNNALYCQLSTDGGGTYDSTNYTSAGYQANNGGFGGYSQDPDLGIILANVVQNDSGNVPVDGFCNFSNLTSSVYFKNCYSNGIGFGIDGNVWQIGVATTYVLNTSVNALQVLFPAGGNITHGLFKLYGVVA